MPKQTRPHHGEPDHLTRRDLLKRSVLAGSAVVLPGMDGAPWAVATAQIAPEPCRDPSFRNSLSVSPFAEQVLRSGVTFTDGSRSARTVVALQRLFNAHGATEVYARIATRKRTTEHGDSEAESGWARGLERARLARGLGMPFNPELGLWAEYGDSAHYQEPPDFASYPTIRLPGPWLSLGIDEMVPAMRQYGALVARQILATGVTVNVWDLGNEVEYGIAGVCVRPLFASRLVYRAPDNVDPAIGQMSIRSLLGMPDPARIAWLQRHLWPHVGRLFAAVAAGIRSVHAAARFSTHIAGLGARSPRVWTAFWAAMHRQGYLPDQFGTSLYPTASSGLYPSHPVRAVQDAARQLQRTYRRSTFVAECGYPSGLMGLPYAFNSPVSGYPQDADGQSRFLRDFTRTGIREGWLSGLRPWAPELCRGGWAPMSFFTLGGTTARPKPALGSIAQAVGHTKGTCAIAEGDI